VGIAEVKVEDRDNRMDTPHQLFLEVLAATGDRIAAIRAIRERFHLTPRQAKEVMLQAEGTAASLEEHEARLAEQLERNPFGNGSP
jgi:hypothetical protein